MPTKNVSKNVIAKTLYEGEEELRSHTLMLYCSRYTAAFLNLHLSHLY